MRFDRAFPALLLLLILLLLPGLVLADTIRPGGGADTWTFYGYGNGYVIARLLEAIKRFASTDGFVTLTMCIALVGFFASGVTGFLGGNPGKLVSYIGGIIAAVYALFGITVDVYVEDMLQANGVPQYGYLVQGVPAAVGLPAVVISEVGMWGIRAVETEFSSPNGGQPPRLSGGAMFGMSAGILRDITEARISDPKLRASIQNYIRDCAIPAIHTGAIDTDQLIKGDVWAALAAAKHYVRYTELRYPNHLITSCENAYDTLSEPMSTIGKQLLGGVGGSSFSFVKAVGDTTLNNVVNFVSAGHTQNAAALAAQAAMIEVAQDGYKQAAIATDSDALVLALNAEGARRSQKTGWFTASMLFQDMAGYFFAILQAFVIGLAPIIVAAMLAPNMGMKIAAGFSKVMIWLVLWWPGLAIVNYIMELYLQNKVGGPLSVGDGLTMANLGVVSAAAENMVIATGFMATMVPGIMWGLISKSGAAFSSVLGAASGGSYASQAANAAASGNVSMGNISMNNTAMNAHQMSRRFSTGSQTLDVGAGASAVNWTQYMSGNNTNVGGKDQTLSRTQAITAAHERAVSLEQKAEANWSTVLQSKVSDTVNKMTQYAQEQGWMNEGKFDISRAMQDSTFREYATEFAALQEHARQQGVSEEEFSQKYLEANAGINSRAIPVVGKALAALGIHGGVTGGYRTTSMDKETTSTTDKDAHSTQQKAGEGGGSRETQGSAQSGSQSGRTGERAADLQSVLDSEEFAQLHAAAKSWQEARQNTERLSGLRTDSQTISLVEGMNHVEYQDYIKKLNEPLDAFAQRLEAEREHMSMLDTLNQRRGDLEGEFANKPELDGLAGGPGAISGNIRESEGRVGDGGTDRGTVTAAAAAAQAKAEGRVAANTEGAQGNEVQWANAQNIDQINREQIASRENVIDAMREKAGIHGFHEYYGQENMASLGIQGFRVGDQAYVPHSFIREGDSYVPVYRTEHENGDISLHVFKGGSFEQNYGAEMGPTEIGRVERDATTGQYVLSPAYSANADTPAEAVVVRQTPSVLNRK